MIYNFRFELFLVTVLLMLFGSLIIPSEIFGNVFFPIFLIANIIAGINLISFLFYGTFALEIIIQVWEAKTINRSVILD